MENLIGYQNSCNFNYNFMLYTPYLYDLVKGPLYLLRTKFIHKLNCKANCKTPIFSHSLVKPHGTYDKLGHMVPRLGYAMWHTISFLVWPLRFSLFHWLIPNNISILIFYGFSAPFYNLKNQNGRQIVWDKH
jgi:hypothetical protein